EQLLHELGVVGAEIGEGVVVDGHPSDKPAEGIVMDTQIVEFTSAGKARECGIQPQGDKQTRINGRTTGQAPTGTNVVIQRCEVQPLGVSPDGAGGVVGFN